jgi:hypothetical protein
MDEHARIDSFLGLRRADQIVPTTTPWLIRDWLVEDTLAGLVAASGSCKSFLAIDWACCIATGTPWNGFAVARGPVVYLAGEGHHGLRKRIAAWEKFNRTSITGAPLFLSAGLPGLCDDLNATAAIVAMNNATLSGPSFIVVDTVARAMGGQNENSSEDMSSFIRALDWFRTECLRTTVLSVHHTGNDPGNQGRARGSSAYRAALDSEFLLKTNGDEVELSTSKSKDWTPAEPMRFRKEVVPIDVLDQVETSLILRHLGPAAIAEDKRPRALELLDQGHSEREVAALLNVGKSTVHRWRTGSGSAPPRPMYTHRDGGAGMDHGANDAGQARGNGADDYRNRRVVGGSLL